MKPIDTVLIKAYHGGFRVQSNFARSHATEVAACASLGFITTKITSTTFGTTWYITKQGLEAHNECYQH